MKFPRHLWAGAALTLTVLALFLLVQGGDPAIAPAEDRFDDTDNPAEQVRALAGELAARDKRLQSLEAWLGELTARPPNESAPDSTPARAFTGDIATAEVSSGQSGTVPDAETAEQWRQAADGLSGLNEQLRQLSLQLDRISAAHRAEPTARLQPDGDRLLWPDRATSADDSQPAADGEIVWIGGPELTDVAETTGQLFLPPGALATDVLLLTSLIGRIPRSGQVISPMPFKALVSASALAAPGHLVPEMRGAIIMGQAVGDLLLHCVRGQIQRVSVIGSDGHHAEVVAAEGESLGYLSDKQGNPCLPGRLVTNFPRTLLTASLAASVESAGNVLAARQQIRQADLTGIQLVNEDADEFLGGSALAGGARTLVDWIRSRSADSFDAVVVPSGGAVVAHFTTALALVPGKHKPGWQP